MLKRILCLLLTLLLALPAAALADDEPPRVKFYISNYISHVDRNVSVVVQCQNPSSAAPSSGVYQLRDHRGNVLCEKEWKNLRNRLTFKFTVDERSLGGSELSVWLEDACVSTGVAYMAISDLAVKRVTQLEPERPAISVTIVCGGGDTEDMDAILAVLEKHGVKATFFINGGYLNAHPEDARRIVANGHELGSHGFQHKHMSQMDNYQQMRNIITVMNEHCVELLGVRPRLFRAPFSDTNAKVTALCRAEGMEEIQWNIDSQDWADKYKRKPDSVVRRVTGDKCPSGSVIQFHLNGYNTPDILDTCIPMWRDMGYDIVTVTELMTLSGRELPPIPERELAP